VHWSAAYVSVGIQLALIKFRNENGFQATAMKPGLTKLPSHHIPTATRQKMVLVHFGQGHIYKYVLLPKINREGFFECTVFCFICRPSDSNVSEDAGIEPWTVETSALAVRRSNYSARSYQPEINAPPLTS
jgi:hypothetical protein